MSRATHTYSVLKISRAAYDEIRGKLAAAGYGEQFHNDDDDDELIDMHGIAIQAEQRTDDTQAEQDREFHRPR